MSVRCCSVAILEAAHVLLHCNSALPGAPFTFLVCAVCVHTPGPFFLFASVPPKLKELPRFKLW
jgi:hypothetical protein